eukprot:833361_1
MPQDSNVWNTSGANLILFVYAFVIGIPASLLVVYFYKIREEYVIKGRSPYLSLFEQTTFVLNWLWLGLSGIMPNEYCATSSMIGTFLFGVMTDAVHARFLVLYFNVALTQHNPDTPRSSVSRSRSNSRPHTPISNPNLSVMQENMNANESWVGQHKHLVGSVNLAICTGAFMFLRMLLFIVTRSIDGTKIEVCDRISMDTGVRFFTYFPT